MTKRVAIIGGSKEAITLAETLHNANINVVLFDTKTYAGPNHIPSTRYTHDTNWAEALDPFDLAIIAPHPFAFDHINDIASLRLSQAAFCRPTWKPEANWTTVPDVAAAAAALWKLGVKRPLVAIGRERIAPLLAEGPPNLQIRCKSEPLPDFGPRATTVLMRGPFTVDQEISYLQDAAIDCIVAHNAGGKGGWPKLAAAQQLNLPVILIDRPDIPWGNVFDSIPPLLDWLRTQGLDLPPARD